MIAWAGSDSVGELSGCIPVWMSQIYPNRIFHTACEHSARQKYAGCFLRLYLIHLILLHTKASPHTMNSDKNYIQLNFNQLKPAPTLSEKFY